MNGPLPDGTPSRAPGLPAEGLRARKKRLMRQQLSDTATAMFLARGFDGVRVAEVGAACGVSEKTVFNYFPAKEGLVMDRLEATLSALSAGLSDPGLTPVQAVLAVLDQELAAMTGLLAAQENAPMAREAFRRFGDLIRATPALRAYMADMTDQAASAAAGILAARAGMTADDPEPQVAASALLGLWRVQADSMRRHLDRADTPALLHERVTADVRRAARLIDTGLRTFAAQDSAAAGKPVSALPSLRNFAPFRQASWRLAGGHGASIVVMTTRPAVLASVRIMRPIHAA